MSCRFAPLPCVLAAGATMVMTLSCTTGVSDDGNQFTSFTSFTTGDGDPSETGDSVGDGDPGPCRLRYCGADMP